MFSIQVQVQRCLIQMSNKCKNVGQWTTLHLNATFSKQEPKLAVDWQSGALTAVSLRHAQQQHSSITNLTSKQVRAAAETLCESVLMMTST